MAGLEQVADSRRNLFKRLLVNNLRAVDVMPSTPTAAIDIPLATPMRRRTFNILAGSAIVLGLTTGCEALEPANTEQDKLENKFYIFRDAIKYSLNADAFKPLEQEIAQLIFKPEYLPSRFTSKPPTDERMDKYALSLKPINLNKPPSMDLQQTDIYVDVSKNADGQPIKIVTQGYFDGKGMITTQQLKIAKNFSLFELQEFASQIGRQTETSEKPIVRTVGDTEGSNSGLSLVTTKGDLKITTETYRSGIFTVTVENRDQPLPKL